MNGTARLGKEADGLFPLLSVTSSRRGVFQFDDDVCIVACSIAALNDSGGCDMSWCARQVSLRCCSILSRAFLHHLQALTSLASFGKLWLDTVTLLSQNLEGASALGDSGSVAAESCQQILTNMVMVVAYAGLLGGQQSVGDTGDEMAWYTR